MDYSKILEAAQGYQKDMTAFLRDMIRIPSESCEEELVIKRIAEEMEKVGFDKVQIDAQGNCLGWMGHGPRIIAFDGHIDTVGVGLRNNWEVLKMILSSAAAAVPTRRAVSRQLSMALRS